MGRVAPRPVVAELQEYSYRGGGPSLHFDQNTNPRVNPVLVRLQLRGTLRHYGDPSNLSLRRALGRLKGTSAENVVVGNGSDEVLELIFRAYVEAGERVAYWNPSFEMYTILATLHGARTTEVPLDPPFDPEVESLLDARAKVTLVASPNNPTGQSIPPPQLRRLAEEVEGLLVVDGAYAEYSGEDHWGLLGHMPNVVVLGTLSKAYGLAGLRVGYGLASPEVASVLRRVRGPYSLNGVAEVVATEALGEPEFVRSSVDVVRSEMPGMVAVLRDMGFEVYPSTANFLLSRPPGDPLALARALEARGMAVRVFPGDVRLAGCMRITLGLQDENRALLDALGEILGGER